MNNEETREFWTYLLLSLVARTEEIEDGEKQKRASELILIYPRAPVAKFRYCDYDPTFLTFSSDASIMTHPYSLFSGLGR